MSHMTKFAVDILRSFGGIAVSIGASGAPAVSQQAASVRDSAGVVIVYNGIQRQGADLVLRLVYRPSLVLGEERSGPSHEFQGITSAVRLSDGTIVVANTSSSELRYFNASGTLRTSVGRRGQGPGEFTSLAWIQRTPGDTVLAYDRNRRISLFDPAGTFVRSHVVLGPPVGRFRDGSYLISTRIPQAASQERGIRRDSSRFTLASPDGSAGSTVGVSPNSDLPFTVSAPSTTTGRAAMIMVSYAQPFGRVASAIVSGSDFLVAEGSRFEIRTYSQAGALKQIVRMMVRHGWQITAAEKDAYIRAYLSGVPEAQRETAARAFADIPFPSEGPAFGAVRVSDGGRFWVEQYPFPIVSPGRWTVFEPDGRLLGSVNVPTGVRILDIGTDYVLGLRRDSVGRELVELFALTTVR